MGLYRLGVLVHWIISFLQDRGSWYRLAHGLKRFEPCIHSYFELFQRLRGCGAPGRSLGDALNLLTLTSQFIGNTEQMEKIQEQGKKIAREAP